MHLFECDFEQIHTLIDGYWARHPPPVGSKLASLEDHIVKVLQEEEGRATQPMGSKVLCGDQDFTISFDTPTLGAKRHKWTPLGHTSNITRAHTSH